MTPTDSDGLGCDEHCQTFRKAIRSFLCRNGFRNCAEEVAEDMSGSLWERIRAGNSYRPLGRFLPKQARMEAIRKANGLRLKTIGGSELRAIPSPGDLEGESSFYREHMPLLEQKFNADQIAGMLGVVAAGSDRQCDLADAAGVSERTFRTKLREMGVNPRHQTWLYP